MPKCPGKDCNIEWQWGWCSDIFRKKKTGFPCREEDIMKGDKMVGSKYTCECGTVLATFYDDGRQAEDDCRYHPDWKDVDWEAEENMYERD